MGAYVWLIVVVVLVVLVAAGLAVSRLRGGGSASSPAPQDEAAPTTSGEQEAPAPDGGAVIDADLPEVSTPPTLERPESAAGRLVRLRQRLSRSHSGLGRGLLALLSRDRLDEATWEDVEDALLTADVGVAPTRELVDRLRERMRVEGAQASPVHEVLREELLALVGTDTDRGLHADRHDGLPGVVLVVGVNGTGKTTTVGKLARVLVAADKQVVLGAADTFRAAAAEQLTTWGDRVGVPAVRGSEGSDPGSVAFEAVKTGVEQEADTVLIDTAGRLQNKADLMDELGKVKRVAEKQAPVTEVLLVLDATTGQNGMVQARVFREVVDVTGIALTKLDGTAKGGIVVAVQRELGVPVKFVGVGEGADDLAPFDPDAFVDALLGDTAQA